MVKSNTSITIQQVLRRSIFAILVTFVCSQFLSMGCRSMSGRDSICAGGWSHSLKWFFLGWFLPVPNPVWMACQTNTTDYTNPYVIHMNQKPNKQENGAVSAQKGTIEAWSSTNMGRQNSTAQMGSLYTGGNQDYKTLLIDGRQQTPAHPITCLCIINTWPFNCVWQVVVSSLWIPSRWGRCQASSLKGVQPSQLVTPT